MKVNLRTIKDVKKFVSIVNTFHGGVDIHSGHYIVDAKSIMGIFSLDLSKPVTLVFGSGVMEDEINKLKSFAVEE